jgi:hypothetical protein
LNGWETTGLASSGPSKEISLSPFACDANMKELCDVELLVTCIAEKSDIKLPIHIAVSYMKPTKTECTKKTCEHILTENGGLLFHSEFMTV